LSLSFQRYGFGIPDPGVKKAPDPGVKKAPDPAVRKAPDPGSGSATLLMMNDLLARSRRRRTTAVDLMRSRRRMTLRLTCFLVRSEKMMIIRSNRMSDSTDLLPAS
jgi:hypothetical protein